MLEHVSQLSDAVGHTLAHSAFYLADPELLKLLIAKFPDCVHSVDKHHQQTPLHAFPWQVSHDRERTPLAPPIVGLNWQQVMDRVVVCTQLLIDAKANCNAKVAFVVVSVADR